MFQKTKTFKGLAIILTASVMLSGLAISANVSTASAEESTDAYCSVTVDRDLSIGGSAVISQNSVTNNNALVTTVSDDSEEDGTMEHPYVVTISTLEQFLSIGANYSDAMISNCYYFDLQCDIDLEGQIDDDFGSYITTHFQGYFYGNGHTIKAAAGYYMWLTCDTVNEAVFENINIVQKGTTTTNSTGGTFGIVTYSGYYITAGGSANVTLNKIFVSTASTNEVVSYGNNSSSFTAIAFGTCTLENCINYAKLNMIGYAGIFLGGYPYNAKVAYINCSNEGNVTGVNVGYFNGNTFDTYSTCLIASDSSFSNKQSGYSCVYVSGCENWNLVTGTNSCTPFASNNGTSYNAAANDKVLDDEDMLYLDAEIKVGTNVVAGTEISLSGSTVGFTGTESSTVDHYVVSVTLYFNVYNSEGKHLGSTAVRINSKEFSSLEAISVDYYTAIIDSNTWDATASTTYDKLSDEGLVEIYNNSDYRLAPDGDGKVIVVSYSSLVENIKTAFGGDVVFSFNGTPTYILNAYDGSDVSLGSNSFKL